MSPKVISFSEFLDLLGYQCGNTPSVQFMTQTLASWSPIGSVAETVYEHRVLVGLPHGSRETFEAICRQNLFLQARHTRLERAPRDELLDRVATQHRYDYGCAQLIVEVGTDQLMAADLKDFMIVHTSTGVGLACLAQVRTQIHHVSNDPAEISAERGNA